MINTQETESSIMLQIRAGIIYKEKHNTQEIEDTLIYQALVCRDFHKISLLLRYGADINPKIFKNYGPHIGIHIYKSYAIKQNDIDMLKFLVKNGVHLGSIGHYSYKIQDQNIKNYLDSIEKQNYLTPIIAEKNYNQLKEVLSKCENIKNIRLLEQNLKYAIRIKYHDGIKLLIEHKADLFGTISYINSTNNSKSWQYIIDYGAENGIEMFKEVQYNNQILYIILSEYSFAEMRNYLKSKPLFAFSPDSCPEFINFMYKYFENNYCTFNSKIDKKVLDKYKADYYQRSLMKEILNESFCLTTNHFVFKTWCLSYCNIGHKLPKPLLIRILLDEVLGKFDYLITTIEASHNL